MTYPSSLREVLDRNLGDLGLFQKAKKYQVYALWPYLVGDLALNAFPRRIDGDVLYVATSSSVWSQELTFMAPGILTKVNNALGGEHFREIRFSEHLWRSTHKDEPGFARRIRSRGARPDKRTRSGEDRDIEAVLASLRTTMRRRVAALKADGYQACHQCGYLFPKNKVECPICKAVREFYGYNRAIAMLEQRPDLTDQAVCLSLHLSNEWLVQRARSELESRWISLIRSRLSQSTRKVRKSVELSEFVAKLASLRSGKMAHELSEREIENILGARLAAILKGSD